MHGLFIPCLGAHLLIVISTVSAAAVRSPAQSLEDQILVAPFDASSHMVLLNTSAPSFNSSDLNAVRAQCSGTRFGTSLNVASCRNALAVVQLGQAVLSFGVRDDGHHGPNYNVKLPYRWLSCKSWKSFPTAVPKSREYMLMWMS